MSEELLAFPNPNEEVLSGEQEELKSLEVEEGKKLVVYLFVVINSILHYLLLVKLATTSLVGLVDDRTSEKHQRQLIDKHDGVKIKEEARNQDISSTQTTSVRYLTL